MKTYCVIFCLIIGSGLASATVQTTASQDRPPRLYVKSYTENNTGFTTYLYIDPSGYSENSDWAVNDNINWTDGSSGSYSGAVHSEGYNSNGGHGTEDNSVTISWSQVWWPNTPAAIWQEIFLFNWYPPSGFTNTWTNSYAPIMEHCDISVPIVDNSISTEVGGYGSFTHATETRTAQTIIKLQTGVKVTSKLRNLFSLTASASRYDPQYLTNVVGYYEGPSGQMCSIGGWFAGNGVASQISSQNICLGSYGNLNANGTKYLILPDDADVDVTPNLAGVDYYTFNLSAPQKYHSYFDVYVQQASPGYSFYPVGENDYGHAFWQFRTDAPADALQHISTNLTKFLGMPWGFYPTNNPPPDLWNLETVQGFVANDGPPTPHPYNIKRTFYIGFPDLLQGLIFTSEIFNAPPLWSATGYNCVSAAREAGFRADVFGLPADTSPQNFGVTLIEMYPAPGQIIGPFIDTNDIFYSSAPY